MNEINIYYDYNEGVLRDYATPQLLNDIANSV